MRLTLGFHLSSIIGLASASIQANVCIFQGENSPHLSDTPNLSLDQTRLVLAQRLGASSNFELKDASDLTLSYLDRFGGRKSTLFEDSDDTPAELVLIIEGMSTRTTQSLSDFCSPTRPSFQISESSDTDLAKLLVTEFGSLIDKEASSSPLVTTVTPSDKSNWPQKSKIVRFGLLDEKDRFDQLKKSLLEIRLLSERRELNAVTIFITESIGLSRSNLHESETQEKIISKEKRAVEEPIISTTPSLSTTSQLQASNSSRNQFKGVLPLCYSTLDACVSSTKNCSGHGECSSKYGQSNNKGACFSCKCKATNETVTWAKGTKRGWKIGYWGGAACQKKDVSSAFWLISIFTVVMLGVVTWGIGMLYSIGEEKLPGVIGASVSGSKSRQS